MQSIAFYGFLVLEFFLASCLYSIITFCMFCSIVKTFKCYRFGRESTASRNFSHSSHLLLQNISEDVERYMKVCYFN